MSSGQRSGARYRRHFLVDNCAFHVERCMTVMQSGTQMVKLKRGTKGLVRLFYLDEHRSRLRWRPSRKGERAKILIDTIYKVTEGRQSEIFLRQPEGALDPSCCFTIYHGLHMEPLDLLTANPEEARTWVTGLKYLLAGIRDEDSLAKRQRTHDQWVKQTFEEADKNGDGLLSIDEIHQLMHKLNVSLPRRKVRQMFQEADTDENRGTLAFEEFCVFYSMMSLRRDLYLLLLSHSGKKDHLTPDELARFLRAEQKMNNVTTEDCLDIIRTFEVSEENRANGVLGIEGFTHFLRSPACDVFNPQHRTVHQDMEQPLSSYYIAASHNTYLTGDQLLSQSRADMYARVLQDGCRCVEVDCWDGPDGEPVVHHGYTLTSKILFRDVVETINRAAFEKNDFPVILSLENHCSVPQQRKLARYLKEILRDKLDLSAVHMGDAGQLPSPQSLRGKILLKSKKLPPHLGADAEEGEVSDEDSADELEEECRFPQRQSAGGSELQAESTTRRKLELLLRERARAREDTDGCTVRALLRATREGLDAHLGQQRQRSRTKGSRKTPHVVGLGRQKTGKSLSRACSSDEEEVTENPGREGGQLPRPVRRRKTMKLCRELSDLVVYTNSVAARDLVDDGSSGNVLSFSEARARQLLQHKWEQLMALNQRQLTRVYPSACRVDSSNFNPLPYWSAGCQLVALNYQSEGRMMQLNRAKFQANGNCGYVLKPQQMCRGTFNPFSGDPFPANPKKQLVLKVISGQQLPKPPDSMFGDRGEIIDPFVEVEILGLPVDCCKDQTRVVDDNGFNPVWEETLTFTVHMPDLALVRFLVWDHDPIGRDFVGQRTVPFSSLAPGYRHVYLEGLPEASLFVHVTINEIYGKWSPLILNPSYTILHVLGATKSRQLQGLKGLFSRNPRPGIAEGTPHAVRKRSLGERILRRSASAPTKGRKKSKLVLQGEVDARDELPEAPREPASVLRRAPRSLQARPVSMPVDRSVLEPLALPLPARAGDPGGQEETQAERQDHGRSAGPATVGHPGLSSSLSSSSSSAPEHPDPPDSDVSRLIDQAALSLDSEPGSSISALLGDPLDEPGVPAESASQPCPSPAPAAPDWAALCFCSADSSLVEVGVDPGTVSFGAWDAVRQDPGSRGSPSGRAPAAPPSHQVPAVPRPGQRPSRVPASPGCPGAEPSGPGARGPGGSWCPRPPPAPALPSPCKSKSLGDLTSEDIACTFEGKYRCISRSFVAAGPPPRPGADALTEQLRRLVSGEPEDARPEALTRKLSSRSQSRVRNIASRARERDAGRAGAVRGAVGGGIGDAGGTGGTQGARARTGGAQDAVGAAVVLRSKPRAGQPLGMRHSTGSYIAGYLGARGAEGRGVPEGCAAPRPGRLHPLCVQGRALQAEPGGANKPEIYFLLRL